MKKLFLTSLLSLLSLWGLTQQSLRYYVAPRTQDSLGTSLVLVHPRVVSPTVSAITTKDRNQMVVVTSCTLGAGTLISVNHFGAETMSGHHMNDGAYYVTMGILATVWIVFACSR